MCFGSRKTEPAVDSESEEDVSFLLKPGSLRQPIVLDGSTHIRVRQTKLQF